MYGYVYAYVVPENVAHIHKHKPRYDIKNLNFMGQNLNKHFQVVSLTFTLVSELIMHLQCGTKRGAKFNFK